MHAHALSISDRAGDSVRKNIDAYRRLNFYRTVGYMASLDALIWRELIVAQTEHGVQGSLAEIGVHHGRSFFILASGRFASEKCLAVDLFEDDPPLAQSHRGREAGFRNNCRKYGYDISDGELIKGNSLNISPAEIITRVGYVRFFSIDGGHMYEHVANDLRLADTAAANGAIICLDDMFSPLWPEVSIAAFDWLRASGSRFVPFLATADKLYLCDVHYPAKYREIISNSPTLKPRVRRDISLLSRNVVVLTSSLRVKLLDRIAATLLPNS